MQLLKRYNLEVAKLSDLVGLARNSKRLLDHSIPLPIVDYAWIARHEKLVH